MKEPVNSWSPTWRAVIIGLCCVVAICGLGYFHDAVLCPGSRLIPHLMPPIVYGGLVLVLLFINPLLSRLKKNWRLGGRELAFIMALALVSCSIPFYGLVHCWPTALMMPHHLNQTQPGWQREGIVELAPKQMLADVESNQDAAVTGYVTGLAEGDRYISPTDVPWSAWARTLAFWTPLALSITIAVIALSLVLHYQWARHEHLPYPIAAFAHSLLAMDGEGESLFRSRMFRIAALTVFGIHMINYLNAWFPGHLVPIRLRLDFMALTQLLPTIARGGPSRLLFRPGVMFSVIGIAYFFSTEVSFSLAVGPVIVCYVLGVLAGYGITMQGGINYLYESSNAFIYLGGYFGLFLAMLYTGRRFYLTVFKRSLGIATADEAPDSVVWAMRIFLLGTVLFVVQLMFAGLDWLLAVSYAGIAIMVFVVVTRALAETGGFYVGTWIMPAAVILAFLGARALGPETIVIMAMVGVVVMIGPGWAPMPFAVQAVALADMSGIDLGRTLKWLMIAMVLGVAVALPATIYWQYNDGARAASGWAHYTARLPFDVALTLQRRLQAQGTLEEAMEMRGIERLGAASPNAEVVAAFAITAVLAIVVSLCRLRFPWWPLHPIVFYFLHSHQIQRLAFSFFLAWLIRAGINKYGGIKVYRALKPAMVGLIAGEVTAAVVPVAVGVVYKLATGQPSVSFSVFLL